MDEATRQEMLALLPRLRRFACALTGSAPDGDDLAQATVERAIRHIDKWECGTHLDAWLFRIARNLHLNGIRSRRLREAHAKPLAEAEQLRSPDGRRIVHDRLSLDEVRRAVARLPDEQRIVLLLVCVEGLSYDRVAEITGVARGTVGSRLARARLALRALIDNPYRRSASQNPVLYVDGIAAPLRARACPG
jgi:RNA polymerase sigma-70 factor, ECF subfamily